MKKNKIILIIIIFIVLIAVLLYVFHNNQQYISKDGIISLIDKGAKSSSQVNFFVFSRESLDDEYTKTAKQGEYQDLIKSLDLSKYRSAQFEFTFLEETEECVLGYFSERDNNVNGTTYVRINKSSGEIKDLDNNLLKVTIYK